jgi:hypothetical protein
MQGRALSVKSWTLLNFLALMDPNTAAWFTRLFIQPVASIVRRGVLVRPTGTVPNQGSQLAVQVPVPLWRWLKEAGKTNSTT